MLVVIPRSKSYEKPKDWAFMAKSEQVLNNIPETWKQYPNSIQGKTEIIDMEYNEFKQAQTIKERQHELIHLASACLNLWRTLEGI